MFAGNGKEGTADVDVDDEKMKSSMFDGSVRKVASNRSDEYPLTT